jgi:hypothetical protein
MKNYTIRIMMDNDSGGTRLYPYMGETEETIEADIGGDGWQVSNHGKLSVLGLGEPWEDEPYVIGGERNLLSHLDKIVRRMRRGLLNPVGINITVKE